MISNLNKNRTIVSLLRFLSASMALTLKTLLRTLKKNEMTFRSSGRDQCLSSHHTVSFIGNTL